LTALSRTEAATDKDHRHDTMSEADNPYRGPEASAFQEEGSRDWRTVVRIGVAASCILAGLIASLGIVAGIDWVITFGFDPEFIFGNAKPRMMLLAECGLAVACVLFFDAARLWLRGRARRAALESLLALGLVYACVHVYVSP
jgi:hypothetical protein